MTKFSRAIAILDSALQQKQASGYGVLINQGGEEFLHSAGYTAHDLPEQSGTFAASPAQRAPIRADSIFDLASLTKILSTQALLYGAEIEGKLSLEDPVQKFFPAFNHKNIRLVDILHHRTSLSAHEKFFERLRNENRLGERRAALDWILALPVTTPAQVAYSDLGHMLLGWLLEDIYGQKLEALFAEKIARRLKLTRTGYRALAHTQAIQSQNFLSDFLDPAQFVATERCPWRKKVLQGEVHDDNCWAMGGVAGHAGLFSTLSETKILLEHLLRMYRGIPAIHQDLGLGVFHYGWMKFPGLRPYPQPEKAFAGALGHTGFVGTSAWIDPQSGHSVILLANRVHPSRSDDRWIHTRLEFHKVLWEELGK